MLVPGDLGPGKKEGEGGGGREGLALLQVTDALIRIISVVPTMSLLPGLECTNDSAKYDVQIKSYKKS